MRICPTCGEVFPAGTERCLAHGVALRDWEQLDSELWEEEDDFDTIYGGDDDTLYAGGSPMYSGDDDTVYSPGGPGQAGWAIANTTTAINPDELTTVDNGLSPLLADNMVTEPVPTLPDEAVSTTPVVRAPLLPLTPSTPTDADHINGNGAAPTPTDADNHPTGALPRRNPRARPRLADRYRLGRKIGIGGYGAVFDAYDERLNKRVAIKVLSPALSNNEEVIARFRREAIAASQVRHQSIVDVTDFGAGEDGTHFIVMELLDGVDLSEVIDGPLDPQRALDIAQQIASALAAAHEAGILHRDLKPANIFLVASGTRPDFVKIIDFGISKITPVAGDYSDLTSASKVVGTPFYMAPEQAQGLPLDGRTDLYALGIILYEMLTGCRPFVGASALEILGNHLDQPRRLPSDVHAPLGEVDGLDALVVKAIAVDPSKRFESMEKFSQAIAKCLTGLRRNQLRRRGKNTSSGYSGLPAAPPPNRVSTADEDDDVTVFRQSGAYSGPAAVQGGGSAPSSQERARSERRGTQVVATPRRLGARQLIPILLALIAVAMVGLTAGVWLARYGGQ